MGTAEIDKINIEYKVNAPLDTEQIVSVYESSGIRRPTGDRDRIRKMFDHANLIVSAWDNGKLVGISRALADFSYCCYLSDLAVRSEYQRMGIGRALLRITKEQAGDQSMLLLLSAPEAMEYYPKMQFESVKNGFIINRLL